MIVKIEGPIKHLQNVKIIQEKIWNNFSVCWD